MSLRGTCHRLDGRLRYWVSQMLMHDLSDARYTSGCDGVVFVFDGFRVRRNVPG